MEFPQTPAQVKEEIYRSIDKNYQAGSLRYRQLKHICLQAKEEVIAEGILQVFEDTSRGERSYAEQDFAGKLLYELKPATTLSLDEILHRTLNNYNLSVEELPLYLADKYGKDVIKQHLQSIEISQRCTAGMLRSIQTFKFWLQKK